MAEHSDQERTEQPTQKRLDDARRKGQVPRSRDLTMTVVMLAGALTLMGASKFISSGLAEQMRLGFSFSRDALLRPDAMQIALSSAVLSGIKYIAPVLLATLVAALIAPLAIGGWNISFGAIAPDWSRISPISGFKRIFGVQGWVELGKAVLKAAVVGGIGVGVVMWLMKDTMMLSRMDSLAAIAGAGHSMLYALIILSAGLAVIAAVDVPYQLWNHNRQLKMSRQEIRDEMKESDGRPEVKSRIRTLQQQMARRRMMQHVPGADVIVTNPTHYAVALKYQPKSMRAPRVVAKGKDLVAAAIRKIGEDNKVPIFESPPLARALYRSTDLNKDIPGGLYVAVAQVLTYIYQLKALPAQLAARMKRPEPELDAEFKSMADKMADDGVTE